MQYCCIWIFDVGRGVAAAVLTPTRKWIMIDLGGSDDFNPVNDFMYSKLPASSLENSRGRKELSQLIISHPHDDHLTCIREFNQRIYPILLTVPNDVDDPNQPRNCKINWDRIQNPSAELVEELKYAYQRRTPPLAIHKEFNVNGFYYGIYYIPPGVCESSPKLSLANYANNISIVARFYYKGNVVLFCGDLMKDGMEYILDNIPPLKADLSNYGVDYLIAPHHGLESSFSTKLFDCLPGNKTKKLNIISERRSYDGTNQNIDSRYSSAQFAGGENIYINGVKEHRRQIKTANVGHVRIVLYENGNSLITTGNNSLGIP